MRAQTCQSRASCERMTTMSLSFHPYFADPRVIYSVGRMDDHPYGLNQDGYSEPVKALLH